MTACFSALFCRERLLSTVPRLLENQLQTFSGFCFRPGCCWADRQFYFSRIWQSKNLIIKKEEQFKKKKKFKDECREINSTFCLHFFLGLQIKTSYKMSAFSQEYRERNVCPFSTTPFHSIPWRRMTLGTVLVWHLLKCSFLKRTLVLYLKLILQTVSFLAFWQAL